MKLMLDIEAGSNGGYVVTYYKSVPTPIQKLAGVKEDKEQLAFTDAKGLVEWINNKAR